MGDEETWTDDDDVQLHVAGLRDVHPTYTAIHFLAGLGNLPRSFDFLASKITPESTQYWGDFGRAAAFIESLDHPGIISNVLAHPDALDVAWVAVIENVYTGSWHEGVPPDGVAAAYLTMVNRPALGGWRVHHLGDDIDIALVPREGTVGHSGERARRFKHFRHRFRGASK